MTITNDQYFALSKLEKWYRKFSHQVIEISGILGTGVFETVQKFISNIGFDPREVMYLSFDQKQVVEMAAKRYHCYYINRIIYNYDKIISFESLPVLNPNSKQVTHTWKRKTRKKIDERYKLIVVFDSVLINKEMLDDLCNFGLPIILMRDPMLIPSDNSYTFIRDPNIELHELQPELIRNPITFFANKAIRGEFMKFGSYGAVSVISKKQLNLFNLKSADMIITLSGEMADAINKTYREKIMKIKDGTNRVGERLIIMNNNYDERLVNEDEKNIKIYLEKGIIGTINKCNKHAAGTKYIPFDFKTDFYFEPFVDLYLDRHYLNGVNAPSRQQIPDDIVLAKYAYALEVPLTRLSHWDNVTLIADKNVEYDIEIQRKFLYNAITRAHGNLTIVI